MDAREAKRLLASAVADPLARPHVRDFALRKSQPGAAVPLPYGLLGEKDRRQAYVVDAALAPEWARALSKAAG